MSVQSLPVPSNLRTEGMCYAQNRLSYLLWNGCPQIVSGSLYCLNQRAGRYHLQRQAVLTFTGDLRRCATWLGENNCKDVCMEPTGMYWLPIYNILEHARNIVLAHPKYVKAIRGKKTDKKDAKWFADIFKHDLVSGSFIPPSDIRQLRDLVCYR